MTLSSVSRKVFCQLQLIKFPAIFISSATTPLIRKMCNMKISSYTPLNVLTGGLYNATNICYYSSKKGALQSDTIVLLTDKDGNKISEMTYHEAQTFATESKMQLLVKGKSSIDSKIECRLKDIKVKERQLQVTSNIDDHDLEYKLDRVKQWLSKGDKVTVLILHRKSQKVGLNIFNLLVCINYFLCICDRC